MAMTRRVDISEVVPPEAVAAVVAALRDDPETWLPSPAEGSGDGWAFYLWVGHIGHLVSASIGKPTVVGGRLSRLLQWSGGSRPTARRGWVPMFDGDLFVEREPNGGATVHLFGDYAPPFGLLGGAADRLLLGGLARRSVRKLLREIVRTASQHQVPSGRTVTLSPPTVRR